MGAFFDELRQKLEEEKPAVICCYFLYVINHKQESFVRLFATIGSLLAKASSLVEEINQAFDKENIEKVCVGCFILPV